MQNHDFCMTSDDIDQNSIATIRLQTSKIMLNHDFCMTSHDINQILMLPLDSVFEPDVFRVK